MKHHELPLIVAALFVMACGGTDSPADDAGAGPELVTDVLVDLTVDVVPTDVSADEDGELAGDAQPLTTPGGLPLALPFEYQRKVVGEPLSPEEVTQFTRELTGLWKQIDYFTWVYEISHGVDESTGFPDYLIWWHDVEAVKEGDLVTFRNNKEDGGSHNNAEPTNLVLVQAIGGYLSTGDGAMGRIVEQFAKSNTACMTGFLYDAKDTEKYVLSRNIVTFNHDFVLPSGKQKAVDYTEFYFEYEGWNAERYNYPNNPVYGDVWVTTMRSKDDVPYIYRAAAWLPYVIELTDDDGIRASAAEMLEYVEGFARDVVDHDWHIRSKDRDGNAYAMEVDLGTFTDYVDVMPDAECDARLATALLATGETLDIDCGLGSGSLYDELAGSINYFNYQIVDHFHLAALHLALTKGQNDAALELLKGMAARIEGYMDPKTTSARVQDENWKRDVAILALKAAALGLPLNADEVQLIREMHQGAIDRYGVFPNFDLWDPSVPDGTYGFREGFQPKRGPDAVRIEEVAFFLEYCWSPFRNKASAPLVDCEIVRNPELWGQE